MFGQRFLTDGATTWSLLAEMVLAGLAVVMSGARLTLLADEVGERLNLGRAWIGMLLLATVTSLPEVATGISSVWIGAPNLAFAGVLGSCSFNIVLIVLLNALMGGGSVLRVARGLSHTLTSSLGLILIVLTLLAIALVDRWQAQESAVWIEGGICVLIALVYISGLRLVYRFEHGQSSDGLIEAEESKGGLVAVYRRIALIAAILVLASFWLAKTGDVLAEHPIKELDGFVLGASFVGAAFLAVATSLPEVVTAIAAVRMNQLDLALGNLFGSNMFNIFVIPMLKLASMARGDRLLMAGNGFLTNQNLLVGLLPILLTAVAVAGLTYRSRRRLFRFGIDSVLLFVAYLAGMYALLQMPETG